MSSVNCRGLRDVNKTNDVLDYLNKTNSNIICLQDTHWLKTDEKKIRKIWNNPVFINGVTSNARGVAILLKDNFEFSILDTKMDENGNMLTLDMTISNEISVRIINIYAPNNDDPVFFQKICDLISSSNCDYSFICGDFNLTIDPTMDSKNYVSLNNPKARKTLISSISDQNLVDIFRNLHPTEKKYTWFRKKPPKFARLDYFICTQPLMDLVTYCKIKPSYRSDHSRLELKIDFHTFKKGPGIWKFNCGLLKDIKYIKLVNEIIEKEKLKYAVPVYTLEGLSAIDDNLVHFTINDALFLEMLLLSIRGETIRYSSHLKKK